MLVFDQEWTLGLVRRVGAPREPENTTGLVSTSTYTFRDDLSKKSITLPHYRQLRNYGALGRPAFDHRGAHSATPQELQNQILDSLLFLTIEWLASSRLRPTTTHRGSLVSITERDKVRHTTTTPTRYSYTAESFPFTDGMLFARAFQRSNRALVKRLV